MVRGAQDQCVQGHGDHGEDDRQDDERVAPAVGVDEGLGQRQEDEAGQGGDQGHGGHGTATSVGAAKPLGHDGEGRLVEHGGHHHADGDPQGVEGRQPMDARPRRDEDRPGDRAQRHQPTGTTAIEVTTDADPDHGRDEQREREGTGELRGREAELALHGQQEDGEGVVEDAPGDRLGDGQRADDRPRARSHAASDTSSRSDRRSAARPQRRPLVAPPPTLDAGGRERCRRRSRAARARPARGLPVAGQRRDDRADLLVAGAQQEGRRAPVALHADNVDAGVGVRELVDAVRRHRPARVQVGVDQRRQRARRLDAIVELQAQLAQQRQIGPEAGRRDDLVDDHRPPTVDHHHTITIASDALGLKGRDELDGAVVHQPAHRATQRAAGRQLVGAPPPRLVPSSAPRIAHTISCRRLVVCAARRGPGSH